jgi:L-rhamnose isomerase/sugar isomerase
MTIDPTTALKDLDTFSIEVPSWAYGNSGTRFKVFTTPGTRGTRGKNRRRRAGECDDRVSAEGVHPHPWDKVDDYAALEAHAKELGVTIGSVNSNLFQDDDYRLGS